MAHWKTILAAGALALGLSGAAQAQTPMAGPNPGNDAAGVFQRYLDAVNAADIDKLASLISDQMADYTYTTCAKGMASKPCFLQFVQQTIIGRHGSLVSPYWKVDGDVIDSIIEVRHDATRRAKAPRLIGTDIITVKNGQIVSFKFITDPNDAWNKKIAAFNAANPPPPLPAVPR